LQWFAELNRGLRDALGEAAFAQRISESTQQLRDLALEIVDEACVRNPQLDSAKIRAIAGPASAKRSPLLAGMSSSVDQGNGAAIYVRGEQPAA